MGRDQIIESKDKTLFLSEELTATICQKNCTNVDFSFFHLPLDHFILGTNRKWPPFFDRKCGGWKLHLLRSQCRGTHFITTENSRRRCRFLRFRYSGTSNFRARWTYNVIMDLWS